MKINIILPVLMVLGLTFGATASKARSTSSHSKTSETTELSTATNNLTASTVESKSTLTENSSVVTKTQKPHHPKKKDWEERTLVGKILIVTGTAIFVVLCIMFGTVSVG